jgi:hypothetical protein
LLHQNFFASSPPTRSKIETLTGIPLNHAQCFTS